MSRKTNRDHAKRQQRPMQEDEAISAQISALLTPALAKQKKYCRQLGLRDRILTLPLMVAAVLTMLWRDVAGVRELTRFEKIWIADGSTLEALFKKLKSLEDVPKGQLAGKIGVVIDLVTRLPVEIWFKENPKTNDTKFEEDLLEIVRDSTLLCG
jgi:hypothetical protein